MKFYSFALTLSLVLCNPISLANLSSTLADAVKLATELSLSNKFVMETFKGVSIETKGKYEAGLMKLQMMFNEETEAILAGDVKAIMLYRDLEETLNNAQDALNGGALGGGIWKFEKKLKELKSVVSGEEEVKAEETKVHCEGCGHDHGPGHRH